MFRKTFPVVLCLMCGATGSRAQSAAAKNTAIAPLSAQLVKTGLYVISGGGSNSLLRLSANGLILVDSKLPGNYEAILAQAKILSFSDQPIRIVISTDHHIEHTGNNTKFLEAGAQIVVHENAKHNLSTYNQPGGTIAPPTRTYDHDLTIQLGGIEACLIHFGSARTSGDTVVYFPNLKAVAVGNLFTSDTPDPDYPAGGSLVGWGPVLDQILKLDFDVAVPSSGPMIGRADLEALRAKLSTLISRATGLVSKGVGKKQLMARLNTDDLGWRLNFTGARLDSFYAELSRAR